MKAFFVITIFFSIGLLACNKKPANEKNTPEQDTLSNADQLSDLITVEKPLPHENVQSPLAVQGKARGMWYFEGEFQVRTSFL